MLFLGIDGGGSKTAFRLEDDTGRELGRFETGPSNWISSGEETARTNIAAGIAMLPSPPDIVCGGFAGAGRPEGMRFYTDCLKKLTPNAQVIVETDFFVTYVGAVGLEPGVLLIAGTGSIGIGRRQDGSMIRVGGWGPMFSDEGSGFWVGREAIRSALEDHDEGMGGAFITSVCQTLGLGSITDVSAAWNSGSLTVRTVASLAATVFRLYPTNPADRILNEAASHLRRIAETAIAGVGLSDCRRSIAGSIASHPLMRKLIRMEFQDPAESPERGAILWARSQTQR
ncbi:MAG TPA: BadF/BadG/BcrA/BcrD ATPase family protein [Terriglobia bacterium]|nr:BadF/BadG/BcrA/BcrD ATPase family protein [Terriglobia bacterium]